MRQNSQSASARLAKRLLSWYRRHKRDLPWRRTRDPYAIWVSEVMLQQTRVETVLNYYQPFLERFPDVRALAAAPEARLLESWAGLGYYRRVRNMHAAARRIVAEQGGRFPRDHPAIAALPGIGEYTAAAIASIAFDLPHGVLDGNVARVVSRITDESRDVARSATRRALRSQVQLWIEGVAPTDRGDLNQALMELGATLCSAAAPRCLTCPARTACRAFAEGRQQSRPVKAKKEKPLKLELAVALVEQRGGVLLRRRPADEAIMPGFWEAPQAIAPRLDRNCFADLGIKLGDPLGEFRHGITFRSYRGAVHRGVLAGPRPPEYRWVTANRLAALPLTTITKKALKAARR